MSDEKQPTNKSDEDLRYEGYLEERKLVLEAEAESIRTFDKSLLTVTAGAFGLSITFLRQVTPTPEPGTMRLMLVAWSCFAGSLLAILFSYLTSYWGFQRQRELIFDQIVMKDKSGRNNWNRKTDGLNIASILLLTLGTIFWVIFTYQNMQVIQKGGPVAEDKKPASGIVDSIHGGRSAFSPPSEIKAKETKVIDPSERRGATAFEPPRDRPSQQQQQQQQTQQQTQQTQQTQQSDKKD